MGCTCSNIGKQHYYTRSEMSVFLCPFLSEWPQQFCIFPPSLFLLIIAFVDVKACKTPTTHLNMMSFIVWVDGDFFHRSSVFYIYIFFFLGCPSFRIRFEGCSLSVRHYSCCSYYYDAVSLFCMPVCLTSWAFVCTWQESLYHWHEIVSFHEVNWNLK